MKHPLPTIYVATLIVLGALVGGSSAANAQGTDIGFVAAANPRIDGTPPDAETRILKLGMNIFQNEFISTSKIGSGQFIFLDQTTLTVSPGSEIVLDRYVFDAASGYGEIVLTLSKGVLRFIGGRITKSGEGVVITPHATIGIRGGIAAITVSEVDCPPLRQDCTRTSAILLAGASMTVKGESKTIVVTRSGGMVTVQSDAPASSDTAAATEPAATEAGEPEFSIATAEDIDGIFESTDTGGDGGATDPPDPVIVAAVASDSGLTEIGAEAPGAAEDPPISTGGEEAPQESLEDSTSNSGEGDDPIDDVQSDPEAAESEEVRDEIAEKIEELADTLGIAEEEAIEVVVAVMDASAASAQDSGVSEIAEAITEIGEEILELADTLGMTPAETTEVVVEVLSETPPPEGGGLSDIVDDISEFPVEPPVEPPPPQNNVAVIGGVSTGGVTEDASPTTLATGGALTISDADSGEDVFVVQASTVGSNGLGTFTLDAAGNWTYMADNFQEPIQFLALNATITDSFIATSLDGSASQLVTVTITGVFPSITQLFTGGYAAGRGQSTIPGPDSGPYVVRSLDGNSVIMGFDASSSTALAEFGQIDSIDSPDIVDITLNFGSGPPNDTFLDDNQFEMNEAEFETGLLTGQTQSISGFGGTDPDINGMQTAMVGTVSSAGLVGDMGIFPAGTDTTPEFLRWGWWEADYQFDDTNDSPGGVAPRSETISGTWVSGVRTDIAALGTSGEAQFDGLATAHVTETGGVSFVDGGRYLMTFDFGTRTGAATITGIAGATFVSSVSEAGAVAGNHFGGDLLDISTFTTVGSIDGSFFTGAGDPTAATGGAFDFTREISVGVTQTGAGIFAADKVTN